VPYLLRRSSDKRRWDTPAWLPAGETPAAPFADVVASPGSQLSVWRIEGEGAESNLLRIVAALAATRDHLDRFDYVLLQDADAAAFHVRMEQREERCPDEEASGRWHWNMLQLTASQLNGLVAGAYVANSTGRVLEPDVKELIRDGIARGQLNRALLKQTLRELLAL
jgi:hypothetical protein